jgi:hypothetical protein
MFVRLKRVAYRGKLRHYVQLVKSARENGRVKQRVVASLGRLDELKDSGELERIIKGLLKHSDTLRVLKAHEDGAGRIVSDRVWGPVIVVEQLWRELGLFDLLRSLAERKRFEFDFERAVFAIVLQRILVQGSDRAGAKWIRTVHADGFDRLHLPHFYRALTYLWQKKEEIELSLYERGKDLFNEGLDLAFFDTTSTYFEGKGWPGFTALGMSKDHRPDHPQLVIGVVMRRDGIPVSCEIWPGNTSDMNTLVPVIERLKGRFKIRKVILVCDRGMVSKANLERLTKAGYEYIVGMKMRRMLEVRDHVLAKPGRFRVVKHNLHVKEIWVEDRRYVVCFNPERAEKDRKDRESIVEMLKKKLSSGGVGSLLNNRGYRRFLKAPKERASIDEEKVKEDATYDGKFVLRTTTTLPATEVAEAYKHLNAVERLWRELKSVLEVRPIFHHRKKQNITGHIFGSFLALYLTCFLKAKFAATKEKIEWGDMLRDLSSLTAIHLEVNGEYYLMRPPLRGCAGRVLQIVGARVPAVAERIKLDELPADAFQV